MIPTTIVATALFLSLVMALGWLLQVRTRNSGWPDAFWSFEVGLAGMALALAPSPGLVAQAPVARRLLVALLVAIWSVRLGLSVLRRTRSAAEDPRYVIMRETWKSDFQPRLFWFLQLQAAAALGLVAAIAVAAHNPAPGIRPLDIFGAFLLIGAIFGESVADTARRQFAASKANRDRICDAGLWGWSRHPDFFFQWVGSLAYPVIALDVTGAYPWGIVAFAGPACLYLMLRHLSGVPLLEAHMIRKHGGNFHAYRERVHTFFPWPPRAPKDEA